MTQINGYVQRKGTVAVKLGVGGRSRADDRSDVGAAATVSELPAVEAWDNDDIRL